MQAWWNHSEPVEGCWWNLWEPRRPMSMWRLMLPLLVAACLGGGCGHMAQLECSGGT